MIDDWRSTKTAPRDAMCVSHAGSLAEQGAEIIIFSRPDRHRINLPASLRISPPGARREMLPRMLPWRIIRPLTSPEKCAISMC